MKRAVFFSLMVILFSMSLAVPAIGEAFDVSDYSTDELMSIYVLVSDELAFRMQSSTDPWILYEGAYVVGDSVTNKNSGYVISKSGCYLLEFVETPTPFYLYKDYEAYAKDYAEDFLPQKNYLMEGIVRKDSPKIVMLEDDMILMVRYAVRLTPTVKPAYMP